MFFFNFYMYPIVGKNADLVDVLFCLIWQRNFVKEDDELIDSFQLVKNGIVVDRLVDFEHLQIEWMMFFNFERWFFPTKTKWRKNSCLIIKIHPNRNQVICTNNRIHVKVSLRRESELKFVSFNENADLTESENLRDSVAQIFPATKSFLKSFSLLLRRHSNENSCFFYENLPSEKPKICENQWYKLSQERNCS